MISQKLQELEQLELERQNSTLNLIASENYAWPEVRAALSSIFSDKYAEGSPGRRFYAGCKFVDELENYAAELACKLFGAEYANLQPLSGSAANQIAYAAFLKPGETILAMRMDAGGHLTHGSPLSLTAKIYNFVHYGLDPKTERIDYAELERLALEHKPKLILAGASAYPRQIDFEKIAAIAKTVNAFFMADIAHIAGLVAAGLHQSPVKFADVVTMTTQKTLRGPRGGIILAKAEHAAKIMRAVMPGVQGGAHFNSVMAKAAMLEKALEHEFKSYQLQILNNAKSLASELLAQGFKLLSGGTDNHLMIVDVYEDGKKPWSKNGQEAELLLESIGIIANRNVIFGDKLSPLISSGIRFGLPALTTRGLNVEQTKKIGQIIGRVLKSTKPNIEQATEATQKILQELSQINSF